MIAIIVDEISGVRAHAACGQRVHELTWIIIRTKCV